MADNQVKIRLGVDLSQTQEAVGVWLPDQFQRAGDAANDAFQGATRVVVFGTDHELQNWVAGAVNGAVQRGVTVQATSSQRGAPVGH